jgi:hypothetical protein
VEEISNNHEVVILYTVGVVIYSIFGVTGGGLYHLCRPFNDN